MCFNLYYEGQKKFDSKYQYKKYRKLNTEIILIYWNTYIWLFTYAINKEVIHTSRSNVNK